MLHQNIQLLNIIKTYFIDHPQPTAITLLDNGLLQLTYSIANPTINKKCQSHKYYSIQNIAQKTFFTENQNQYKLLYDQNGFLYQTNSILSVNVKDVHQKIFDDPVFGKPICINQKWVYIAQAIKQKPKSFFLGGNGVNLHQKDFGQTYEGLTDLKMFVWNKKQKQTQDPVVLIQTDNEITPAFPIFSNAEATKVIFQGFKKQQFGYGLLYCFNREVDIYQMDLRQTTLSEKVIKISQNQNRTNLFPNVSPCFKYMIYASGNGITHCFYLDLVIMKKVNQKWTEHHRLKQLLIGYYEDLVTHIISLQGRSFAFVHTVINGVITILKVNLKEGSYQKLVQNQIGQNFRINQISLTGQITGFVQRYSSKSFFYIKNSEMTIIPPQKEQDLIFLQFNNPIHSYYIEAKSEFVHEKYKNRLNNRPLIVMIHGGPHGTAQFQICLLKYCLLKVGYAILLPNFSGSTGFGQKYLQNALGEIGEIDAQQIINLIKFVLNERPSLDKTNVNVYGSSYGGYMSATMASKYSQYFRSSTIKNGDLALMASFMFTDIPQWNTVEAIKKSQFHNLTEADYAKMFRLSPIVNKNVLPTLQLLGKKDLRCPYRQGLFYDCITKRSGGQIQTYVYQQGEHELSNSVQIETDVVIKIIQFLQRSSQTRTKQ